MPTFEVLPGLPGEGPPAVQFSATGQGTHREGFVVRFLNDWVGNFQPGETQLYRVLPHPNRRNVLVISGGQAYIVDPKSRSASTEGGWFIELLEAQNGCDLVFSRGTDFELWDAAGRKWRTRRVSWDGFRNLTIAGDRLLGEAWSFDDSWHKFAVELVTGEVTGGAYDGPDI